MDDYTIGLLFQVIERYQYHKSKTSSLDPDIVWIAQKMCEIDIYEMYLLTQGRLS